MCNDFDLSFQQNAAEAYYKLNGDETGAPYLWLEKIGGLFYLFDPLEALPCCMVGCECGGEDAFPCPTPHCYHWTCEHAAAWRRDAGRAPPPANRFQTPPCARYSSEVNEPLPEPRAGGREGPGLGRGGTGPPPFGGVRNAFWGVKNSIFYMASLCQNSTSMESRWAPNVPKTCFSVADSVHWSIGVA